VDYNKALYNDKYVTGLAGEALDNENPYDIILAIPPSHYMEYDGKNSKYVARFYNDEHGGSVLGGNAIMGHDVFFDIDNKRIGWAESKCDYSDLVKEYEFDAASGSVESEKKQEEKPVDTEPATSKPTPTKPPETKVEDNEDEPAEDGHDEDAHSSDNIALPAKPNVNVVQVCSGMGCRGAVLASMLGVLLVGVLVGRSIARRGSYEVRYQETGLEVPTLHLDEDDAVDFTSRYRDHPDDEDSNEVVEEGVGYEDDDELDPREIA
jgi:hypothetical protein